MCGSHGLTMPPSHKDSLLVLGLCEHSLGPNALGDSCPRKEAGGLDGPLPEMILRRSLYF